MRIGIFVVTAGRQGGGPETYEVQLIRALARIDRTSEYFIYCTTEKGPPAIGVTQANFSYRVLRPSSRWISIPFVLPLWMIWDRIDFYHATMVPPPWSPKPFLMTILCSSNWFHPEFYPKRVAWRLNRLIGTSLPKATSLLCISEDLLEDVHQLWHVPLNRLTVTYMGVAEEFFPSDVSSARTLLAERYAITSRYLLFIGQQQERKNVFRVLEAYALFRMRFEKAEQAGLPRLLLVGREVDDTDDIANAIRQHAIADSVDRRRYVSFQDLPSLYRAADALVFPSLWEGFGLPVVESMACGTPVITSTATCLPEIADDAALIVDPQSSAQIADAIYRIQTEPDLREALVRRGFQRAKRFTWDNCARRTLEVYRAMLQHSARRRSAASSEIPA